MSPSGLVVSKLAVQATAADDSVNGILCLKISLPVTEARQPSRWPLFTSAPPKLLGSPIVQPLPLSAKSCRHSKRLQTVATLLALPQPTAYPPPLAQGVARPSIDVSSTTGQVYVVLNSTSTTNRRHDSARRDPSVRREYLAVLEFQVPVEDLSKVSIPLPKCLDNVIRFQIVSPDARGEVSILTEPKMLPLPASAFSAPAWSPAGAEGQKRVGTEDGWEDGEDHGPEEPEDEDEQDDSADEGSWLEGRFQSTDTLRLEWSFASCSATSKLRIDPHYNAVSPSIHLFYEGTVDVAQSPATLEAILPEGWGWKSLSIASHSLLYWTCADADWGMPHPFEGDHEVEDSFSTVHSRSGHRPPAMPKPSPNAPSLMRTTMPDMSLEEFSFEMNSFDTTRPRTPVSQRPSPPPTGLELDTAQAGSSFDLQFEGTGHHVVVLEATLVPLDPLLLVSPSVPVQIPVIRLGEGEVSVECPAAKLEAQTVSTTVDIIGTFVWTDGGRPLTPIPGAINGEVSVRIQRKHWWSQRLSISFRWPRGIQEISICLPVPAHALRLDRATLSSTALLRALVDTHGACELRLGRPSSRQTGHAEIVLDVESVDGGEISVPWFKDGSGQMTVKLAGENWPGPSKTKTNLSRSGGDTYTTPIPSARPYIRLTDTARSGASSRLKGLVSSSTLVHLFTLWLLVSLAQQVQRLRTEIAFVAEETRDLRLYGMQHVVEPLAATVPSPDPPITDEVEVAERTEYPLGRVVWGHSRWGWQDLTHHPTIVTLGRGLGWSPSRLTAQAVPLSQTTIIMEFLSLVVPTSTISVNPPGGTGHPNDPQPTRLPLPTDTFPSPHVRFVHATATGHTALWVIFALFTAGLLGTWILALRVERRARIFHWLSAAVLTIAMVSYLAMATGLGVTYVPIHNHGSKASIVHLVRAVYFARYIDWLFTTPLLLISLGFLAGLSPASTLLAVLADIFMVVTGLFAGIHSARWANGERARWLWFAISCVGFVVVWVTLFKGGVQAAKLRQRKTRGLFYLVSAMTLILWIGYPIVFGLSEGVNKISVDAEIIAYGVLDVAAKLGFTYLLLLIHTHGEDDTWILPEWFIEPRPGLGALDGRTGYGAIRVGDD